MSQQISDEEAKFFLKRIMPNKDYLYIFAPFGLDNFFFAAGLSHAIQKKKNKKTTVLITSENMRNYDFHYENVEKISYLSYKLMPAITRYTYASGDYEDENYIYGSLHADDKNNFIFDKELNVIDRFKKNVFDLPLDTPFHTPIVEALSDEHIDYLNKTYVLDKERTIILAAPANKQYLPEINFWRDLIRYLNGKGYVVYTYIENFFERPFPNTKPITTNFSELSYIADNINCVIGARLGGLSLFATTNAKILSVVSFPAWYQDIKLLYPKCNCQTFYDTVEFIQALGDENAKANVVLYDIELSHPKIKPDSVFYSYDDVLKNILQKL